MTKECTCKGDKKDPKCPVCSKKTDFLRDFHRLNPGSAPEKTAAPAPGFFSKMLTPDVKQRLAAGATNALIPAAAVALPTALAAGATADKGEGLGDAAKAGLTAGGLALAGGLGHNMMMTGKSPVAKSYQQGIGTDFRNLANKGREAVGLPTVRLPKAASDNTKTANPGMHDPYANYGQYGQEPQENHDSGLNTALAMGGTALGAGLLHHGLMGSTGRFAQAYQNNLGRAIRGAANQARSRVGLSTVAQPHHPLVQDALGALHNLAGAGKTVAAAGAPIMAAAGAVGAARKKMQDLSTAGTNEGELYRNFVERPAQAVGSAVRGGVENLKKKVRPANTVEGGAAEALNEMRQNAAKKGPAAAQAAAAPEIRYANVPQPPEGQVGTYRRTPTPGEKPRVPSKRSEGKLKREGRGVASSTKKEEVENVKKKNEAKGTKKASLADFFISREA